MSKIDPSPIAILGGTFDPIHNGHLRIAEEVADALQLAHVSLIPSGHPPHRAPPQYSAIERLHMCKLAVEGNARLRVDDREVKKQTASYTVDTLLAMRAEQPSAPQVLILGADAFLGLPKWHRWLEIFELAHIALVARPGFDVQTHLPRLPEPLKEIFAARYVTRDTCGAVRSAAAGKIVPITVTALDISATKIRALLSQGKSVRYLLPERVATFLEALKPMR